MSSSVPWGNFNAYNIIWGGLSWSHYINVMDTQIPGQEHLITDIIPINYMEAIQ